MTYTFFEHISDIGIKAESPTLEGALEDGAAAMLEVMFELDTIVEVEKRAIKAEAGEIETLFVEVLNEILSIQCRDGLALKRLKTVELKKTPSGFSFKGEAFGEPIDLKRHVVKTEVKGATYSALKYVRGEGGTHTLQCILDV
ncbi:MAG: archease [Thermodesulfobacteriota bacterium]